MVISRHTLGNWTLLMSEEEESNVQLFSLDGNTLRRSLHDYDAIAHHTLLEMALSSDSSEWEEQGFELQEEVDEEIASWRKMTQTRMESEKQIFLLAVPTRYVYRPDDTVTILVLTAGYEGEAIIEIQRNGVSVLQRNFQIGSNGLEVTRFVPPSSGQYTVRAKFGNRTKQSQFSVAPFSFSTVEIEPVSKRYLAGTFDLEMNIRRCGKLFSGFAKIIVYSGDIPVANMEGVAKDGVLDISFPLGKETDDIHIIVTLPDGQSGNIRLKGTSLSSRTKTPLSVFHTHRSVSLLSSGTGKVVRGLIIDDSGTTNFPFDVLDSGDDEVKIHFKQDLQSATILVHSPFNTSEVRTLRVEHVVENSILRIPAISPISLVECIALERVSPSDETGEKSDEEPFVRAHHGTSYVITPINIDAEIIAPDVIEPGASLDFEVRGDVQEEGLSVYVEVRDSTLDGPDFEVEFGGFLKKCIEQIPPYAASKRVFFEEISSEEVDARQKELLHHIERLRKVQDLPERIQNLGLKASGLQISSSDTIDKDISLKDMIVSSDNVFVFIHESRRKIFVWVGDKSGTEYLKYGMKQAVKKRRQLGYHFLVQIVRQGAEPIDFWSLFTQSDPEIQYEPTGISSDKVYGIPAESEISGPSVEAIDEELATFVDLRKSLQSQIAEVSIAYLKEEISVDEYNQYMARIKMREVELDQKISVRLGELPLKTFDLSDIDTLQVKYIPISASSRFYESVQELAPEPQADSAPEPLPIPLPEPEPEPLSEAMELEPVDIDDVEKQFLEQQKNKLKAQLTDLRFDYMRGYIPEDEYTAKEAELDSELAKLERYMQEQVATEKPSFASRILSAFRRTSSTSEPIHSDEQIQDSVPSSLKILQETRDRLRAQLTDLRFDYMRGGPLPDYDREIAEIDEKLNEIETVIAMLKDDLILRSPYGNPIKEALEQCGGDISKFEEILLRLTKASPSVVKFIVKIIEDESGQVFTSSDRQIPKDLPLREIEEKKNPIPYSEMLRDQGTIFSHLEPKLATEGKKFQVDLKNRRATWRILAVFKRGFDIHIEEKIVGSTSKNMIEADFPASHIPEETVEVQVFYECKSSGSIVIYHDELVIFEKRVFAGSDSVAFWLSEPGIYTASLQSESEILAKHDVIVEDASRSLIHYRKFGMVKEGYKLKRGETATILPSIAHVGMKIAKSLIKYPHGCAEQTSAKLYGLAVAEEFASRFNLCLAKEAKEMVDAGIARLTTLFATSSYFFSYWEGGEGSRDVSIQVLRNLTPLKENGTLDEYPLGEYIDETVKKLLKTGYRDVSLMAYSDDFIPSDQSQSIDFIARTAIGGIESEATVHKLRESAKPDEKYGYRWAGTHSCWSGNQELSMIASHALYRLGEPEYAEIVIERALKRLSHGRFHSTTTNVEFLRLVSAISAPLEIRIETPEGERVVQHEESLEGPLTFQDSCYVQTDVSEYVPIELGGPLVGEVDFPEGTIEIGELITLKVKLENRTRCPICQITLPGHLVFPEGGANLQSKVLPFIDESIEVRVLGVRRGRGTIRISIVDLYDESFTTVFEPIDVEIE